ncbi:hypothetical protein EYW49_08440 [Siculibacillus lacustris]|uniref:Cell division protein FtsL n=1 Tax=Siculibacillus lacustris TaxID=1549641 RepID=A0A4Q9VSA5_9HYPH|nr:hypothetical protein [Siculibacillus lacustris]TBW38715.1 hypothetical protein EYW49_08440 [Siculibacillus lacustris]
MLRTINILLVATMLVGAGVVYDFKYEAERATAKLSRITRKIEAERDATATLKAEWSLLNQPKRLQDLATRYRSYLELDPLDPTQIGTIDDIPFKPVMPPADSAQPAARGSIRLAQPDKPIERTGSIGKLVDRLPPTRSPGAGAGVGSSKPATTVANPAAPMQLVPRTIVPTGDAPQVKVVR